MNTNSTPNLKELAEPNSSKVKYCEHCGKPITFSSEFACCYSCQDTILFGKVKEYIRNNNVTEIQVAKHFGIPLRVVKQWIHEERIDYRK